MIRKETAIKLIECFERLGQEYDYYTDDNITNEKNWKSIQQQERSQGFRKMDSNIFSYQYPV